MIISRSMHKVIKKGNLPSTLIQSGALAVFIKTPSFDHFQSISSLACRDKQHEIQFIEY